MLSNDQQIKVIDQVSLYLFLQELINLEEIINEQIIGGALQSVQQ